MNAARAEQAAKYAAVSERIAAPREIVSRPRPRIITVVDFRPAPRWEALDDRRITVPVVIDATCRGFVDGLRVMPRDVIGGNRLPEVVRVRQVSMYLVRNLTGMTMPVIGKHFGGMDHTTVLHAIRKIGSLMELGDGFSDRVEAVRLDILSRTRGNEARSD